MLITAIIPCYNEEAKIAKALQSVQFAEEVLVVDSYSTDKTLDIVQQYGARIILREYGYSASQKNWAIPQATNEWVVLLDADEWLSEELQDEIQRVVASKPKETAFWIRRDNYYMGRKMRFGGWKSDKVIRLFRRDLCRYEDKKVHAEIICDGEVGMLKNAIGHDTYKGISESIKKTDRYTTWAAVDRVHRKKIGYFDLLVKPAFAFFRDYIIKLGILDGMEGLFAAKHTAWVKFIREAKIWRLQKGETLYDPYTNKEVK